MAAVLTSSKAAVNMEHYWFKHISFIAEKDEQNGKTFIALTTYLLYLGNHRNPVADVSSMLQGQSVYKRHNETFDELLVLKS